MRGKPWRLGPKALLGRRLPAGEALALWRAVEAELDQACRWQKAVGRLGWVPAWAESPEQAGLPEALGRPPQPDAPA